MSRPTSRSQITKRQPLYPQTNPSPLYPQASNSYATPYSSVPSSSRSSPLPPSSDEDRWGKKASSGSLGLSSSNITGGGGFLPSYEKRRKSPEDLEGQNDERLDGLFGKVKMLKDITVSIGNEVKDGNMDLQTMNDHFAQTSYYLKGTMRRMTSMARNQSGKWCWFMMFLVLVVWIFVVLWWFRR
ncbi:V-SNARE [Phaffia rhodozyma]|uniref:V-SNARE n=1 Tax=Phaffia rhodozyma TaxID=264483 RepID=A0A0F7SPR2_PHARH|nr:V-SNARE [Phaffia rhodozyma]